MSTQQHYDPANVEPLRRAVAVAQWELGDGAWAYRILDAYFNPDDAGAAEAIAEIEAGDGS